MRIMKMAGILKDCLYGGEFDVVNCIREDLEDEKSILDDEMLKQRTEMMEIFAMPLTILLVTMIVAVIFITCCCFLFIMTTENGCIGRFMTMKLGSRDNSDEDDTEMAKTKKERTEK